MAPAGIRAVQVPPTDLVARSLRATAENVAIPRKASCTPDAADRVHFVSENPDYQVRFHWEVNSIAFWDNRVSSRLTRVPCCMTARSLLDESPSARDGRPIASSLFFLRSTSLRFWPRSTRLPVTFAPPSLSHAGLIRICPPFHLQSFAPSGEHPHLPHLHLSLSHLPSPISPPISILLHPSLSPLSSISPLASLR